MRRAVIDTNVLLEGITRKAEAGRVIDAWADRRFVPCVSTALALEYEEVLLRKFGGRQHETVLAALQALLRRAEYVPILSRVRPLSPDPDDDFVIECAFNSASSIVTRNERDFRVARSALGILVLDPEAFLKLLED
jgi:putative PIN family toxin of toxin-antitoxin system